MSLYEEFGRYFEAMDKTGGEDRCFLCRRTSSEVKAFFGFREDGVPEEADSRGLEDVVLEKADIMSYRGSRPVCAVCQLNYDAIFALGEQDVLAKLLHEMEHRRPELWPGQDEPH